MQLYHHPYSLNSQKVRLALEEIGIDCTSYHVNPITAKNMDSSFFKMNPSAKLPVFQNGSHVIFNTIEIIQYIERIAVVSSGTNDVTPSSQEVVEWMHKIQQWNPKFFTLAHVPEKYRLTVTKFIRRVVISRMAETPEMAAAYHHKLREAYETEDKLKNKTVIKQSTDHLVRLLDEIELKLGETAFLAGEEFTMADAVLIPVLARLELLKVADEYIGGSSSRPNIAEYWMLVQQRPSYKKVIGKYFKGWRKHKTLMKTWCFLHIRTLLRRYKGVQYKSKNGEEKTAHAPLTIVCDGCFSNLRRSLCKPMVDVPSCFVGLVLENCQLPFANHGHVVLGDPSPILFYPISSTEIRCLVDVPGQKVPSISNGEMEKYLKTIVAPQVPPQIHDAFIAAIDKGNIRTMPNRSMPAAPQPTPGALLMGDAFNMRHPLTGGGMTVALSDIVVLRNLLKPLKDLNDAPTLCKYLESFYTLRKPVASTINTLAGALYKVFCASPDQARKEMRQACFDYLSLGGIFSNGPVSLLSGLNPRPLSLVLHFFAVAIYGVGRLLLPFPSPKGIWIGARLVYSASGIIFPIIKAEGVRQMFFPATVPAYYRSPPVLKTIA